MAFYRQAGDIPRKRHRQHRRPDGGLYAEELMGEDGFVADSSLLYHRGIPALPGRGLRDLQLRAAEDRP